jgi:Inner membrane protein YgaP-like, transmembrane domain
MNSERIVRIVAGSFVMLSLALGIEASPVFVSKYFLFFTAFVGLNLFQSGFTRFCPLNNILARFGVKSGSC